MNNEEIDLELEGLDEIPELFHISSIRDPQDPPLVVFSEEVFDVKRWTDAQKREWINNYRIIQEIGSGAFGSVFRVEKSGEQFAMKVCNLIGLEKKKFFAADGDFANSRDILNNEINILKRLNHKNISKCFEILHGNEKIYTINELGNLGQIMNWNNQEKRYIRNPQVVNYIGQKYQTSNLGDITRIIFFEVCQGVKYLHDSNITNRDIKVDNILCRTTQQIGNQIKIVDFTTVRYKQNDDISYFPTGTPGFRGPEHQFAASDGYSSKASDIWCIGYSLYVFYYQIFPFYDENEYEMDARAKDQQLIFDPNCPAVLFEAITRMTKKEWKDRININEALDILNKT